MNHSQWYQLLKHCSDFLQEHKQGTIVEAIIKQYAGLPPQIMCLSLLIEIFRLKEQYYAHSFIYKFFGKRCLSNPYDIFLTSLLDNTPNKEIEEFLLLPSKHLSQVKEDYEHIKSLITSLHQCKTAADLSLKQAEILGCLALCLKHYPGSFGFIQALCYELGKFTFKCSFFSELDHLKTVLAYLLSDPYKVYAENQKLWSEDFKIVFESFVQAIFSDQSLLDTPTLESKAPENGFLQNLGANEVEAMIAIEHGGGYFYLQQLLLDEVSGYSDDKNRSVGIYVTLKDEPTQDSVFYANRGVAKTLDLPGKLTGLIPKKYLKLVEVRQEYFIEQQDLRHIQQASITALQYSPSFNTLISRATIQKILPGIDNNSLIRLLDCCDYREEHRQVSHQHDTSRHSAKKLH